MKMNPLVVFTGFALATLATLVVVEKDRWMGDAVPVAKREPAAPVAVATKPEDVAKADAPEVKPAAVPTFDVVRVEQTGETVIAGRAEPGSEVTVKYNGATVGTATTNTDGAFVVTPEKPLPKGPGALSIEMKNKDTVVASADTVAVDVKGGTEGTPLVAVLKDGKPTALIQTPSKVKSVLPLMNTVNLDTVDYDEAGNIVFSGRGPTGSKVQLYVDNKPYALADIGADGTWTMPNGEPLAVGAHELRADEIGADGSVTSRVAIPFFREDPKKVASVTPVIVPDAQVAAVAPAAPEVKVTIVDKTTEVATSKVAPVAATATTTIEVAKPVEPVVTATAPVIEPPKVETPAAPAAPVVAAATPAAAPTPAQIIIQPGNNLWKLSRQIYGKGTMYTVIYEANKDQIRRPGLIYPGQVFMTPDASKAQ